MRYIRTENGIFEVLSEYDTPENTTLISNPVMAFDVKVTPRTYSGASIRIIYSNEVISQADTIEELCDCFVTKGNRHIVWDKQQNKGITFEQVKESFTAYHFKIYGAIWTDKGLIYVAKLNEKGELELI